MSTDPNFWREKKVEADSNQGPSAYQPNTLPLGQTGSHCNLRYNAGYHVFQLPVKMERENNLKEYKTANDLDMMPKFGAGSEFGRDQKEEARRKKYGIILKKYNPEEQPWHLKVGSGKQAKKWESVLTQCVCVWVGVRQFVRGTWRLAMAGKQTKKWQCVTRRMWGGGKSSFLAPDDWLW